MQVIYTPKNSITVSPPGAAPICRQYLDVDSLSCTYRHAYNVLYTTHLPVASFACMSQQPWRQQPHVPQSVTADNDIPLTKTASVSSSTSSSPSTKPFQNRFQNRLYDSEEIPLSRYTSNDDPDSDAEMVDRRPPLHRPTDGKSGQPLLAKGDLERGRTVYDTPEASAAPPLFSRRSTFRSRSPDTQAKLAAKQKYTYAAFFLILSLISFTVQTETAVYIQHELKWNKAYCML